MPMPMHETQESIHQFITTKDRNHDPSSETVHRSLVAWIMLDARRPLGTGTGMVMLMLMLGFGPHSELYVARTTPLKAVI